jgi:pantothenate kinase type III
MLLVVDVGNTQTHFGTWRDDELVEHWRSRPSASRRPTSSAPRCAACSSCAA